MSVQNYVVADDDILARFTTTASVFVLTRLDTDTIVAGIEAAVLNQCTVARLQVECITIL
jgi:hypothetical protein